MLEIEVVVVITMVIVAQVLGVRIHKVDIESGHSTRTCIAGPDARARTHAPSGSIQRTFAHVPPPSVCFLLPGAYRGRIAMAQHSPTNQYHVIITIWDGGATCIVSHAHTRVVYKCMCDVYAA